MEEIRKLKNKNEELIAQKRHCQPSVYSDVLNISTSESTGNSISKHCQKCHKIVRNGVACMECGNTLHFRCGKVDPSLKGEESTSRKWTCDGCRRKNNIPAPVVRRDEMPACSDTAINENLTTNIKHVQPKNVRFSRNVEKLITEDNSDAHKLPNKQNINDCFTSTGTKGTAYY